MRLNHCVVQNIAEVVQQVTDNSGNKGYEMICVNWFYNNSRSNSFRTSWNLKMRDDNCSKISVDDSGQVAAL